MARVFAVQVQIAGGIRVSRYKFDRNRELIPGYKVGGRHWCSVAVQTVSEPGICHGAGFRLRADAGVRVQEPLRSCLGCRSTCLPAGRKAKSVTNNLPILSVLWLGFYVLHPIKLDYFPTGLVHDFQIYYFCLSETNLQAMSQILS